MKPLIRRRAAALVAAGASALILAAPADAAPDRASAVGPEGLRYDFTTPERSGFVYTGDVSSRVPPCTPVLFDCDKTLIEVKAAAQKLTFKIDGTASETFSDVDLHVFRSDAAGTQGALLGESTSAALTESVTVSAASATPGFYLVYLDWYFGRGAINGTVTFTPKPVTP